MLRFCARVSPYSPYSRFQPSPIMKIIQQAEHYNHYKQYDKAKALLYPSHERWMQYVEAADSQQRCSLVVQVLIALCNTEDKDLFIAEQILQEQESFVLSYATPFQEVQLSIIKMHIGSSVKPQETLQYCLAQWDVLIEKADFNQKNALFILRATLYSMTEQKRQIVALLEHPLYYETFSTQATDQQKMEFYSFCATAYFDMEQMDRLKLFLLQHWHFIQQQVRNNRDKKIAFATFLTSAFNETGEYNATIDFLSEINWKNVLPSFPQDCTTKTIQRFQKPLEQLEEQANQLKRKFREIEVQQEQIQEYRKNQKLAQQEQELTQQEQELAQQEQELTKKEQELAQQEQELTQQEQELAQQEQELIQQERALEQQEKTIRAQMVQICHKIQPIQQQLEFIQEKKDRAETQIEPLLKLLYNLCEAYEKIGQKHKIRQILDPFSETLKRAKATNFTAAYLAAYVNGNENSSDSECEN